MPKTLKTIATQTKTAEQNIAWLIKMGFRAINFFIFFSLANAGFYLWNGSVANGLIAIFCLAPMGMILLDIRRWRSMHRSLLFNTDAIKNMARTNPILMAAFDYAHAHYRADHADILLKMPKILELVHDVEFKKSRTATPAEAEQLVKELADAAGMKEVES